MYIKKILVDTRKVFLIFEILANWPPSAAPLLGGVRNDIVRNDTTIRNDTAVLNDTTVRNDTTFRNDIFCDMLGKNCYI